MSEQPPSQPDQPTPAGGTTPPPASQGPQYPQPGQQPPPGAYGAAPPPPAQGQPPYPQAGHPAYAQAAYPQPGHPGQPYPQPGTYQRPQKKRPKAWWFAVGAILLVAGIGIGVALFVTAYSTATEKDGVITANAQPANINAPAGEKRMLFVPNGDRAPSCALVDGTGKNLLLRPIFGEATLETDGIQWQAFSQVDSAGDGKITITCTPTTSGDGSQVQVRMGAPIDVRTIGGGVVGGLAAIFLLGGAGFVILLVTTILWFSRKPVAQG